MLPGSQASSAKDPSFRLVCSRNVSLSPPFSSTKHKQEKGESLTNTPSSIKSVKPLAGPVSGLYGILRVALDSLDLGRRSISQNAGTRGLRLGESSVFLMVSESQNLPRANDAMATSFQPIGLGWERSLISTLVDSTRGISNLAPYRPHSTASNVHRSRVNVASLSSAQQGHHDDSILNHEPWYTDTGRL